MPLSEDEQKILHQIEQQFLEHDPVLAGELENTTLWRHALNRMKWATAAFFLGVVVLIVALATATSFVVAFGGFVVMLAATLWFERNARKLGRAWLGARERLGSHRRVARLPGWHPAAHARPLQPRRLTLRRGPSTGVPRRRRAGRVRSTPPRRRPGDRGSMA